jgi:hypothetical protein
MTPVVRSIGPLVPAGPISGTVVHASRSGAHVVWSDDSWSVVHGTGGGRAPWSIEVDGFAPATQWTRAGDVAACRLGRLRVGALVVPLAGVTPWSRPAPPPPGAHVVSGRALAALAPDRVQEATRRVGWRARSASDPLASPAPLVGLGPGLTPSGDDVVVGALCACTRRRLGGPRRAALIDAARRAAGRTTEVGARHLAAAADGWFAEPLVAVVDAPDASSAAVRLPALLALGATSGADLLLGVIAALAPGELA